MNQISDYCRACRTGADVFPFTMAFQPVLDLAERRIDAYEALVRGPQGEGAGFVLGQVTDENRYAFDQACRVKAIELATKLGMHRRDDRCRLNINFLPNAVYEPAACIRRTLHAAALSNFPLDRITFEIVEQEEMQLASINHLNAIIAEYRRHGFKVALDDFSNGYSGLSRMAELKPDIVKIDRVLIQDCDRHPMRMAIIAGMIAVCRNTDIKLVMEGVETEAEVAALLEAGARYMQGFYFARPSFEALEGADAINWLPSEALRT